jgi:hypothetical protein
VKRSRFVREQVVPIAVVAFFFAAVTVAAMILAGGAKADPISDVAFLQTLDQRGITYTSATQVIGAGHAVCTYLDVGGSLRETVDMVAENSQLGSDSAYFVGVSIGAYCPRYAGMVLA